MSDLSMEMQGLTDFQRRTARYVFRRMYLDPDATTRFLVADEVGLGKTMVARAVVAQTITRLRDMGDRRIDIVYVCSNAAIARQNLRKLVPPGTASVATTGRLSLLPGQRAVRQADVNLIGLTPGTSLHQGSSLGTLAERALALEFVGSVLGRDAINDKGVYRAFAGNIGDRNGNLRPLRTRFAAALGASRLQPVRGAKQLFEKEFRAVGVSFRQQYGMSLREGLETIAADFRTIRNRRPEAGRFRNDFIGHVRRAMAATGAALLRPDLVIFDEFQRFADLLHDTDSDVYPLVEKLIGSAASSEATSEHNPERTRTLLLSATPYRMHTTDVERAAGDVGHYEDFLRTVTFLGGEAAAASVSAGLRQLRAALLNVSETGIAPVVATTAAISDVLRKIMVRTERLASTPDRDGMLSTCTKDVLVPDAGEIRGYLAAMRIVQQLPDNDAARKVDLVELWKSTPYLLTFLNRENYQVKERLHRALQEVRPPEIKRLAGTTAALSRTDMESYAQVKPANARLRHLMAAADPTIHELLWLPAAAPYYRAGGRHESDQARTVTKQLVFSAWNAVPNAISALLSYEVERATIGAKPGATYSDAASRATRPLRLDADTTYPLLHPSIALAELIDPLMMAADAGAQPTWQECFDHTRRILAPHLERMTGSARPGAPDASWYWLAMVALDLEYADRGEPTFLDHATADDAEDEAPAYRQRVNRIRQIVTANALPDELGRPPDDLLDILTIVALASPAVCALRALRRVFPQAEPAAALAAAARIASGFRAMFNGPEAAAVITRHSTAPFWRECLQYAADGNVQAVLDEYLHVVAEWQQFDADKLPELADLVHDAATLRAVPYKADVLEADGTLGELRIRGRYATRFGRSTDENNDEVRADQVSDAFNSPFWPFVLATTSIGQEGLDFHLYCHSVVHWNLPHNPVDLEQREGRVHRYKGHAVRKNVAERCGLPAKVDGDPWRQMFATAAESRPVGETDIVPYWVFDGPAKIQRHLLVQPYTREASVLPHLLSATAMYRLAFGQPRQDELLNALGQNLTADLRQRLAETKIDLSPPVDCQSHGG